MSPSHPGPQPPARARCSDEREDLKRLLRRHSHSHSYAVKVRSMKSQPFKLVILCLKPCEYPKSFVISGIGTAVRLFHSAAAARRRNAAAV